MINTILTIAAGGALGAVARHGVNVAAFKALGPDFPWSTMIVNVAGSFLMGVLITVFAHAWQPPEPIKYLLITGFLGAFTTFSAFSLDVAVLFERHAYLPLAAYMIGSIVLSISALFLAMIIVRQVFV